MNYLSLNVRVTFPFGFPSCHILRLIVIYIHQRKLFPQKKKTFHVQNELGYDNMATHNLHKIAEEKTTIIIKNHFNMFLLIYVIL